MDKGRRQYDTFWCAVGSDVLRERLGVEVRRDLAPTLFRREGDMALYPGARFEVSVRAADREMKSEIALETRRNVSGKEHSQQRPNIVTEISSDEL